jgi:hypothetical protein
MYHAAMINDPEIKAMNDAYEAVKDLDLEAKARVLAWLSKRCGAPVSAAKAGDATTKSGQLDEAAESRAGSGGQIASFDSVADLFAACSPKTDGDKSLLVAVFLQEKMGQKELTGYEINKQLNHLGHGVKNITMSIQQLIDRKPQLMIQTKKEGTTKQAKKKYKVTAEGIKAVKQMLRPTEAVSA